MRNIYPPFLSKRKVGRLPMYCGSGINQKRMFRALQGLF